MCEFGVHATVRGVPLCKRLYLVGARSAVQRAAPCTGKGREGGCQPGGLQARVVVLPPAGVTVGTSVTTSCTPWPAWALGSVGLGASSPSPGGREGASGHAVPVRKGGARPWRGGDLGQAGTRRGCGALTGFSGWVQGASPGGGKKKAAQDLKSSSTRRQPLPRFHPRRQRWAEKNGAQTRGLEEALKVCGEWTYLGEGLPVPKRQRGWLSAS